MSNHQSADRVRQGLAVPTMSRHEYVSTLPIFAAEPVFAQPLDGMTFETPARASASPACDRPGHSVRCLGHAIRLAV